MIEMSKTFEKFQLVLNFALFFTLNLLFSIHEKYRLAKIWGWVGLQSPSPHPPTPPPVSAGLYHSNISRLMFHGKFLQSVNFVMKDGGFANT